MITMTTPAIVTFFWKCLDCLSVGSTESPEGRPAAGFGENANLYDGIVGVYANNNSEFTPIRCGCGGRIEYMGQVIVDRLSEKIEVPICDSRCTHAAGPKCGCQCGGKNHKSGRTIIVRVDLGPLPVVTNLSTAESIDRAREWRALYDETKKAGLAVLDPLQKAKSAGRFLPSDEFAKLRNITTLLGALYKQRGAKDHGRRMKAVEKIRTEIAEVRR